MSLSVANPLGLVSPPNSVFRPFELGGKIVKNYLKRVAENKAGYKYEKSRRKGSRKNIMRGGSGNYKGAFPAARPNKPTVEDLALSYGSGRVLETFGSCAGTEICWVGASTLDIGEMAKTVAQAIIRKLFAQAGLIITNPSMPIISQVLFGGPGVPDVYQGGGFEIVRQRQNAVGDRDYAKYTMDSTDTLEQLAVDSGLVDEIIDYSTASNNNISKTIRLFQIDANFTGVQYGKCVSTLNMNNEKIHLTMKCKFIVQNRTLGATGSVDTEVLDAQPLQGKIYHFNKSHPIVREVAAILNAPNTDTLLGRWSNTGVQLVSNTVTGYDQNIRNPPSPYFWTNCSKSGSISLEPGDLKDVSLYNKVDKFYPDFMASLAWYDGAGVRRQKIGDCVFIALEERLNSGSINPVKVQYENELTNYCYLSTDRVCPMLKTYDTRTQSL